MMKDMRRIAALFVEFKRSFTEGATRLHTEGATTDPRPAPTVADMMMQRNFREVEHAVKGCTVNYDKAGSADYRNVLFYLLRRASRLLEISYLAAGKADEATEVNLFVKVLLLNRRRVFGEDACACAPEQVQETTVERPTTLPSVENPVQMDRDDAGNKANVIVFV